MLRLEIIVLNIDKIAEHIMKIKDKYIGDFFFKKIFSNIIVDIINKIMVIN